MKRLAALLLILPLAATAQTHDGHRAMNSPTPSEGGQAGFAAMSEIVTMLRQDPQTDWAQVDIGALRAHLRDMDQLFNVLEVTDTPLDDGMRVTISRNSPGADAAWRMVPSHAPVLAAETGWQSSVDDQTTELIWTIRDAEAAAQIRGLGFFGLMALGNHHPQHHLGLATGAMMH